MGDLNDWAVFADEVARDSRLRKDNELLRAEVERLRAELAEANRLLDLASQGLTARDEMLDEAEKVVEAARATAEAEQHQGRYSAAEHWQRTLALIAAVDSYDSRPAQEETADG